MRRYFTAGAVAQGVRRPRLEADRRLPDPQPDPPRPRVPDQGGARGLRRPLPAPADRRDQEGRHPRRRADEVLRGPDGELLPERPGRARRQPGGDALRRPARGDLPRGRPPQLRRHALHRRPRPRRRRRLLRHLRRAGDLRRGRHREAGDPPADVRAHLLVLQVRGPGLRQDLPAHARGSGSSSRGTKVREMLEAGETPPPEFTRHEVADDPDRRLQGLRPSENDQGERSKCQITRASPSG